MGKGIAAPPCRLQHLFPELSYALHQAHNKPASQEKRQGELELEYEIVILKWPPRTSL